MSLHTRGIPLIILLLFVTGGGALALFSHIAQGIAWRLGTDFAARHVLWQTERVDGAIARELALSQKLADSRLLHRWALAEDNPRAQRDGVAELESFGRLFSLGGWFVAFSSSGRYYFDNAQGDYRGRELIKTLSPDRPDDAWFFTTLASDEPYAFNIDYDAELDVTNLWINTIIVQQGSKLGITGTGLDLTRFINEFIHSTEAGVSSLLLNRHGAIVAHEDRKLINMQLHNSKPENWGTMAALLIAPRKNWAHITVFCYSPSRRGTDFSFTTTRLPSADFLRFGGNERGLLLFSNQRNAASPDRVRLPSCVTPLWDDGHI